MSFRFVSVFVAAVTLAGITLAQSPCATDDHHEELTRRYPQLARYETQFMSQLTNGVNMRTTAATDTLDIPIVVHVVHDYSADNVDDNTIFNAVATWTDVFMGRNADTSYVIPPFKPYIGNARIHLHLATIDPNGKPTKGITRTQSYLASVADDQAKYDDWPNNKYINIWLIGSFPAGSPAAAYAYYPSSGASMPYYDGVICRYDYVNVQKTIPHELGHALNLSHTWGSTNNAGVACGDDGVDDTPPTKGHVPGCSSAAVYDATCAAGYSITYMSAHGIVDSLVDYPDTVNAQNIMDYTYCELMFSAGQTVRMRNALTSPVAGRNNLYSPTNLAATGALTPRPDLAPIADYCLYKAVGTGTITDKRTYFLAINNPGSFWFKNSSWNDTITDIQWTFSNGATIPATNTQTVLNRFSMPGWVTVSLVANSNAGSDTLVNTHAVYVADSAPAGGLGYLQDFATPTAYANWPMFNYYNNPFRWSNFTGAGVGDNNCLRYRSFDTSARIFGTAVGDYDDVFSPSFNLAGITDSLYLNFYTSGASTSSGLGWWETPVEDQLEIDASVNGGAKWVKIISFYGPDLSNNGDRSSEFVPAGPAQWKARTVSVPFAYRTPNTFFRFRYLPGNTGNNLYLDNFRITSFPTGIDEIVNMAGAFNIYPNPSASGCNLVFHTGTNGLVTCMIKDLAGKTVYENKKEFSPFSLHQEVISRDVIPAPGLYFVTLVIDGISSTQKLVVY